MAKQAYLPAAEPELVTWLENFILKIDEHGSTVGLSTGEITVLKNKAQALIDEINKLEQIKNDKQQQTATKNSVKKDTLKQVRADVRRVKADPGYTDAIGQDIDIIGAEETFDPDDFKTVLKAEVFPSYVRLGFTKENTDGVNIYYRLKGETTWRYLARDSFSPYYDTKPLSNADTPETREYMAIGVIDDEEIGQQSDIASAVFGG